MVPGRRDDGTATVVIAAWIVVGTFAWWHAENEDGAPQAFHDHRSHHPVFAASAPNSRPSEHCFLCHWLRTLGNGFSTIAQYRVAAIEGRQVLHLVDHRTAQLAAAILPARAPPA
jgi:hypothetical protein